MSESSGSAFPSQAPAATNEPWAAEDQPARGERHRPAPSTAVLLIFLVLSAVLVATIVFAPIDGEIVGAAALALTTLLIFSGVHVAVAMTFSSLLGIWKLAGVPGLTDSLFQIPFEQAASWSLSVLPMFVLMGILLWRSGITEQLFAAAKQWLNWLPGGLAIATNAAGAGLASASGSTVGISYTLGRIAIPEMLRAGYRPSLATAVVAMSGALGQLIPPSLLLVIYAGVAQTPVGPQLLAGLVPGIVVAAGYGTMIVIRSVLNPSLAPKTESGKVPLATKMRSLRGVWALPALIAVIVGGLYGGFLTATEAGAIGAFGALLLGAWSNRKQGARGFGRIVVRAVTDTVGSVAAIMLLIVGVGILTRLVTMSGLAQAISDWTLSLGLPRTLFLFSLILVYLVLGMFMESLTVVLLTVPIFAPALEVLNVDMIWFGVFVIILAELAMVTPPVGLLAFIIYGLTQDREVSAGRKVSLGDVFVGCMWFLAVNLIVLVLLIFVPDLALWLPSGSGTP